jgi:hypothetical protein
MRPVVEVVALEMAAAVEMAAVVMPGLELAVVASVLAAESARI